MRLGVEQTRLIREVAAEMFGPTARVFLFGSRTDDAQRGGDIDLLIEVDQDIENRPSSAARFAARLQRRLGDRRIDVLLTDPRTDSQPIHQTARRTGIRL